MEADRQVLSFRTGFIQYGTLTCSFINDRVGLKNWPLFVNLLCVEDSVAFRIGHVFFSPFSIMFVIVCSLSNSYLSIVRLKKKDVLFLPFFYLSSHL